MKYSILEIQKVLYNPSADGFLSKLEVTLSPKRKVTIEWSKTIDNALSFYDNFIYSIIFAFEDYDSPDRESLCLVDVEVDGNDGTILEVNWKFLNPLSNYEYLENDC